MGRSKADLKLVQNGAEVTGTLDFGGFRFHPYSLKDGRFADGRLTGSVMNEKKNSEAIELELSANGKQLQGRIFDPLAKSKCEANPSERCEYEHPLAFAKSDGSECSALIAATADKSLRPLDFASDVTGRWVVPITRRVVATNNTVNLIDRLDLTQNGAAVTGKGCYRKAPFCYDIDNGSNTAGRLSGCLFYRIKNGERYALTLDLVPSADGEQLEGYLHTTEPNHRSRRVSFEKQLPSTPSAAELAAEEALPAPDAVTEPVAE